MAVLGIDIGGTKISGGIVSANAAGEVEVGATVVVPTRASEGYAISSAQLHVLIGELLSPEISAIGICAPGPLNPKTGVVINPPNLPGWSNIALALDVEQRYGVPCRVENDANAACLAENLFGAARGLSSVFYVTWSTGVGAGIVLDGKIYHGKNGAAAEGGHVTIDYTGDICNCGSRGCIEVMASGTAMAVRARRLLAEYPATVLQEPVTAQEIGRAAVAGDPLAMRVLDESALMMGAWLGSMISILDPDIIVIGGGVAQIGEPLFARLRKIVPTRTINQFAADTPIVPAHLGANSGILGAAAVVMEKNLCGNHTLS